MVYLLIAAIIVNSLINFFERGFNKFYMDINFYDIFIGLLLFTFLYSVGKLVKESNKLDNTSIGIVMYLFSFFIFNCLFLLLNQDLLFTNIILIVNLVWLSYFLFFYKNKIKSLFPALLSFITLKSSFFFFSHKLTVNNNLTGDVSAVFFEQAKNIYEVGLGYSLNNYVFEGYPQFISYFQSMFLGLVVSEIDYSFFSFTSHIVFYLSLLFFLELKISKFGKTLLISLFSLLIYNSSFLKFLFSTSLMSDGLVSLFTAIALLSVLDNIQMSKKLDYKLFLIFGIIYFSKQFNSSLIIIWTISLFLITHYKKIVLFGFSGLFLKELLYLTVFKELNKDHHIQQIDIVDTALDLLLLRDLNLQNFTQIVKNLWLDKPISILFILFYFVYIMLKINSKKFDQNVDVVFIGINLNILFVILLYVSVWRNMELESPIRYFLNLFHLILVSIFVNFDKLRKT